MRAPSAIRHTASLAMTAILTLAGGSSSGFADGTPMRDVRMIGGNMARANDVVKNLEQHFSVPNGQRDLFRQQLAVVRPALS